MSTACLELSGLRLPSPFQPTPPFFPGCPSPMLSHQRFPPLLGPRKLSSQTAFSLGGVGSGSRTGSEAVWWRPLSLARLMFLLCPAYSQGGTGDLAGAGDSCGGAWVDRQVPGALHILGRINGKGTLTLMAFLPLLSASTDPCSWP